ncbi:MAG: hypothetical protein IPJ41_15370 [Phycisphaerales bacterium]|nr:hypothetical protein [Phycisphaerales bacterium]
MVAGEPTTARKWARCRRCAYEWNAARCDVCPECGATLYGPGAPKDRPILRGLWAAGPSANLLLSVCLAALASVVIVRLLPWSLEGAPGVVVNLLLWIGVASALLRCEWMLILAIGGGCIVVVSLGSVALVGMLPMAMVLQLAGAYACAIMLGWGAAQAASIALHLLGMRR